jgi:tetratricopeptide (TPR) repeat protein
MADRELAHVVALVGEIQPALERNDRATVKAIIKQLVAVRAPMGDQWQQLAYIAAGYGEQRMALQSMDLFVDYWGGRPSIQFQKVSFLAMMGDWDGAYALVRTLPETVPDTVGNLYSRGSTALYSGRTEEASGYFARVTRMRPQSGITWFGLSIVTNFAREPDLADRLIAAAPGMESIKLEERVPFQYALGKVHADRGDHTLAFEAYALGAKLMKSVTPYDREADRAEAAKAVDGYSAERIAAIAEAQRDPTGRTIFVTGLPRSGTTLVEQILTSHSAVSDGGEISRLLLLSHEIGGTSWPALAGHVEAQGTASAARLWHHWLDELYPASGRIVDKSTTTSRFLGLAAALLPDAPVIWMKRDPLDCAWSCFRTNFVGAAIPWSYDLSDIAAHFRLEDQLLAQWQEILGDRLLVVAYEDLVTHPEPWIRRILAHCNLVEEPQVFAPHENKRAVATASMLQVRRPINRDGIGASEPYRAFLKPFIEAYYG